MTRYLEREPRKGDLVRVEFNAKVTAVPNEDQVWVGSLTVPRESVRVIAPEPKVGDVVTADMDLPDGSIIERATTIVAVREHDGRWWMTATGQQRADWHPGTDRDVWRIVRIGGA